MTIYHYYEFSSLQIASELAVYMLFTLASYFTFTLLYRLYLSPIAKFPGSKLTAATGWYETYLDVFEGGQFTFKIEKWHKQYGLFHEHQFLSLSLSLCLRFSSNIFLAEPVN